MVRITEKDVLGALPMRDAIRLVRESFVRLATGASANQARRRLVLPTGSALHQLGGSFGDYFGCKIYSTHVKHGAHFLVLLYDAASARPLAVIDANHLGQIRTGAASAVATDLMALPDADTLGVIGTGFQARTQVEAILAVRDIRHVRVWSRSAERREAFARDCSAAFGREVVAAASAEEAVRGAGVVVTATYAKDPVVEAAWIAPGAHVNAMGSNNPQRREVPADLVARAEIVAVDSIEQARAESGDLLLAWSEEDWESPRLVELQEIAAGRRPGRTMADAVTIFKSNGLGVQDIAVAGHVYERCVAVGV
jgi:ornithine cyclodeaminase/alanine dehydrogenase-like protein (mu-crystallin family)